MNAFYLTAEVPGGDPFPPEIHGRKVCGLLWCWTAPQDKADAVIQEARDVAEPLFEFTGPMPYPTLQSMFDGLIESWARDDWKAVHRHTVGGAYLNFMMEEGHGRIQATYGDNYPRLQEVKARYDPDNFFRVNQNIEPSG